jgi:hypothetical protein
MPTIPIFNDELATSVEASMVFPNDLNKARAYACWLALRVEPMDRELSRDARVAAEIREQARHHNVKEGRHARAAGNVTGHLIKTLWALIRMDRNNASMNMAIQTMENQGTWDHERGIELSIGKSTMTDNLREFRKVLHLWGAWRLPDRAGKVHHDVPSAGYCRAIEIHSLLAQSEVLLHELQLWSLEDKLNRPHLAGGDFYRPPPGWSPPES